MARLLILVAQYLLGSALKRILLGAGLGFGSYLFLNGIFEKYIELAQQSTNAFEHGIWGLLALAGLTKAISLLISATVARMVIQTSQLALRKL